MTDTIDLKRNCMHLRVDAKTKSKLAREKIALSPADWDAFYDALTDPPAPNKKLRQAVRRYRERTGG